MEITKLDNIGYQITNHSFNEDPLRILQLIGNGRVVVIKNGYDGFRFN